MTPWGVDAMSRLEWTIAIIVAVIVLLCLAGLVYLAATSDPTAGGLRGW